MSMALAGRTTGCVTAALEAVERRFVPGKPGPTGKTGVVSPARKPVKGRHFKAMGLVARRY